MEQGGREPKAGSNQGARPVTLDDFEGAWHLSRRIDHDDGTAATFTGRAEWSRHPDGLRYDEDGTLSIAGRALVRACRSHIWERDLTVRFADGRIFHKVPPGGGAVRHRCAPDIYDGIYRFSFWPNFTIEWHVTGPRKAYRIISDYRPAG